MNTRSAGGTVNKRVIHGIFIGLIKSDLSRFGGYLKFAITNGWLQSLYRRMGLTRRTVTALRPATTKAAWLEVNPKFLYDIVSSVVEDEIPDELVIMLTRCRQSSYQQITSQWERVVKSIWPENVVMTDVVLLLLWERHLAECNALSSTHLHYKTSRSLPHVEFPEGFSLSSNEKHWSSEVETLSLVHKVINPYTTKVKKD